MPTTCWTCGSPTAVFTYQCVQCEQLSATHQIDTHVTLIGGQVDTQLRVLKSTNEEIHNISAGLNHLNQSALIGNRVQVAQLNELRRLSKAIPKAIARVESAIRWGCEQLIWHIQQQTKVIRSIDETLKTPVQTKANEWRVMADTLRERGALNDAVDFYEKSLAESPLDYRTYVGFADALIQLGRDDRALAILSQSLPHAPRNMDGEISDWRSQSLRTIAHIHHCRGSHDLELKYLQEAVGFSPKYQSARYELAVAAAECHQTFLAVESLDELVHTCDLYYEMAHRQQAFVACKEEITPVLRSALNARIANRLIAPLSLFRQGIVTAKQRLVELSTSISTSVSKKRWPSAALVIANSSNILFEYRVQMEDMEGAQMPVDTADIEVRSRHVMKQHEEFRTEFATSFTNLEVTFSKLKSEDAEERLGLVLLLAFIFFIVFLICVQNSP